MAELPTQRDFEDFTAWSGRDVLDPDGDRLGAVEAIFLDEATGVPEWVLVRLGDDDAAFVPLVGANVEERAIRIEQPPDRVSAAPRPEPAETLSVADERRLYEHYGLRYSEEESSTLLPTTEERPRLRKYVGAPVAPPAEPDSGGSPPPPAPAPEQPDTAPSAGAATPAPTPTPTPIPEPAPTVVPPEGGFQAHEDTGSQLPAALQGRTAISVGLGAAIAGLIVLLILRRRR